MRRKINDALRRLPVWVVWLGGMIPLALLVSDTFFGGLGIDPVRDIEYRLGRTALYFLIASLGFNLKRRKEDGLEFLMIVLKVLVSQVFVMLHLEITLKWL